ncbi:MarR family winged helix-turn-helix transcriptional regulator [Alkaliphilus oremlandii]|uniref:Transcriptional regulator, MarR family n=1 Tax=Alkaliphilus oremlandii (strain OhILAs) TaxID=350688 RepID=A8MER8_ALKOO|nr:MarR family transcriptional regulator [Alkaliphilus oremlandii]ABW18397.1 transcriptional regulator, MarR family [Alkaliphilus oremlandii OhILAs]
MELHQCINFLLSTAQNTVFQYFNQKLSQYNITPAQYGVLNCLWEHGELTPKQIGEFLVLEASSISGILERMQKNNLIERNIHPNNRRTIVVTTTEQADDIRHNIEEIVSEMNHKFLSFLSEDERHLFTQILQKIIHIPK